MPALPKKGSDSKKIPVPFQRGAPRPGSSPLRCERAWAGWRCCSGKLRWGSIEGDGMAFQCQEWRHKQWGGKRCFGCFPGAAGCVSEGGGDLSQQKGQRIPGVFGIQNDMGGWLAGRRWRSWRSYSRKCGPCPDPRRHSHGSTSHQGVWKNFGRRAVFLPNPDGFLWCPSSTPSGCPIGCRKNRRPPRLGRQGPQRATVLQKPEKERCLPDGA